MKFERGDVVCDRITGMIGIVEYQDDFYVWTVSHENFLCRRHFNKEDLVLLSSAREQAMEVICCEMQKNEPCVEPLIKECNTCHLWRNECIEIYQIHRELQRQGL